MSQYTEIMSMSPEELAQLRKELNKKLVCRIGANLLAGAAIIIACGLIEKKIDNHFDNEN